VEADTSAILVVLTMLGTMGCLLCIIFVPLSLMLLLPLAYRKKCLSWTEGRTPAEAYEAIAVGATRGLFQIRPASYLHEVAFKTDKSPAEVLDQTAKSFTSILTQVINRDEGGIIVNMRFPPTLGPGWVGVVLVEEGKVRARFRSTYAFPFPVITFFLSLQLHLHLQRMLIPRS
jgi:hypothetical protein